jgi:NYN domain
MNGFHSHQQSRQPIRYLFIDGGYLRGVLEEKSKRFFSSEEIDLNFEQFTGGYKKKFYYDCLPPKKPGEERGNYEERIAPRLAFYDKLRGLNGFHVFLGSTMSEGGRARQKGVDIMIAVHTLTHSFRHNMEQVTLLTGDLDFKPLIDALVQDGMDVTLWFDPISTSQELIYSADSQQKITIHSIHSSTSIEFRAKHHMVQSFSQSGKQTGGYSLVKSGTDAAGKVVEFFESNNPIDYPKLVVIPDPYNSGYYLHFKHKDLGFIEKVLEDDQHQITWK